MFTSAVLPDRTEVRRITSALCIPLNSWRLTLKLEGKRIADIRFRAKGCVPAMACGSAITESVKGRNVDEARQLSREELVQKVGGLAQASAHASHLAMDTLAALLRNL